MNFRDLRRSMIVLVNTVNVIESSRETALAKTAMQKAMMWTGTYMKFSGLGENPYEKNDGTRKTVADIQPMFDFTLETLHADLLSEGQISVVDSMRTYLGEQIDAFMAYGTNTELIQEMESTLEPENLVHTNMCMFNIYTALTEARMWLGTELGRIRDAA